MINHESPSHFLWGEMESQNQPKGPGLSAPEKELLTRLPRPLPMEGPKIHQPSSSVNPSSMTPGYSAPDASLPNPVVIVPFGETSPRDPYVIQGIQLLDYLHRLNDHLNRDSVSQIPPPPAQLTDPLPVGARANHPKGPFSGSDIDNKQQIEMDDYPRPSFEAVRAVLHKSTASLAAFSGYDSSADSALDLLTDAAGHFMKTLCSNLLRKSRDDTLMAGNEHGFSDVMDRTMVEMTGCGLQQIPLYYHHSIINRYLGIANQCRLTLKECHQKVHLESHYPNMQPGSVTSDGGFTPEIGTLSLPTPQGPAKNSDPDNIPEIHLPSTDEQDSGNGLNTVSLVQISTPQMETGMQMLQSLEEHQATLDSNNSMAIDSPVPSFARTPSHSIIVAPGSVLSGPLSLQEEEGSPDTRFSQQQRKRTFT